ncbi:hypothetical protein BUALT_Bualt06G0054700 [Buddleja alternifolia]|uniref:GRF-type domain-containing protein n=1 Tax=Buddleja alternifolia TaxID=168488 RepID=A0AAV6XP40_9LAMI|nr:hypothetical protein BUALT_Bualt06G0054700 [Buddleja alternifolia]
MAAHVNNICYCMRLAKLKCSWTDSNSGRRFYGCELNQNSGGCEFFEWFDPPTCNRSKNVIPGLLRNMDRLETQLRIPCQREKWAWVSLVVCLLIFFLIWLGGKSEVPQAKNGEMKQLPSLAVLCLFLVIVM